MKQFPVSKEYYYAMKQAKDRDIRMALSNIISLRLKLEFAVRSHLVTKLTITGSMLTNKLCLYDISGKALMTL